MLLRICTVKCRGNGPMRVVGLVVPLYLLTKQVFDVLVGSLFGLGERGGRHAFDPRKKNAHLHTDIIYDKHTWKQAFLSAYVAW